MSLLGAKALEYSALFSLTNNLVLLDDVNCTGTEDMLLKCSHASIGHHSCGHPDESYNVTVVIQCKGVYSSNPQEAAIAALPLTMHQQAWVNPPHEHTHM